jgi:tetratricopeptide (TPR) repeat protein
LPFAEPDGDTSVDTFERGSEDSFTIKIADLGVLKKLRIGHDGSGVGSAWFLHKVRIINLHTSEIYVFPAYQDASVRAGTWLDLKEYEGVSPDKLEVELGAVLEVGVDGKPRQHTEQVVPLPTGMQVVASMTIEALQRSLAEKLTTQIAILEKRQQEAIHRGDFEENKAIDKEIQSVQALLPGVATHSMNLLCALAYFQDATIPTSLFADAAANKAPVSRQAVEDAILVQPAVAIFWDPAVFERSFASLQAIGCIQCVNDNLITHGLMQRSLRMALDMKDDSVAKVVTALLKSRVVSKVGSEASWPDVVPLLSLTWSWFSREACPAVDSAECSWALGRMLEEHGFIDDALPLYEYALFAYQHEFGPLHPKTSTVYNNLGNLYEQHQQWDHALDMYQRALHASEELLGKTHIQISSCCINLAGAHKALDQDIDALPLYRRALFLREQQDAQSTDTATACHHLGMLHAHMKNAAAAFEMFAQALAIRKQKLGISDLETVQTRQALVNAYMDLKMFIEAIPLIQEHLDLCCPENQPDVLLLNNLGYCYEQTNAVSLAIETYLKTMAAAQAQMGPRDQLVGVAAYRLGVMYFATGEFELALPMYELAIEITGDLVEDMSASLNNIGIVYLKMGMHDKAEPPLRQALAMRIEEHGKDHADSMETLWHIAVLLVAKCEDDAGIQEEALQNLRDVISFRLISFGNEHSDFKAAMSLLEVL